jgi:hypothetical protein
MKQAHLERLKQAEAATGTQFAERDPEGRSPVALAQDQSQSVLRDLHFVELAVSRAIHGSDDLFGDFEQSGNFVVDIE